MVLGRTNGLLKVSDGLGTVSDGLGNVYVYVKVVFFCFFFHKTRNK